MNTKNTDIVWVDGTDVVIYFLDRDIHKYYELKQTPIGIKIEDGIVKNFDLSFVPDHVNVPKLRDELRLKYTREKILANNWKFYKNNNLNEKEYFSINYLMTKEHRRNIHLAIAAYPLILVSGLFLGTFLANSMDIQFMPLNISLFLFAVGYPFLLIIEIDEYKKSGTWDDPNGDDFFPGH